MVSCRKKITNLLSIIVLIFCRIGFADIQMPMIFGNNMVLQQKSNVAVWGWAESGEKVTVKGSWGKFSAMTYTGKNGKWLVAIKTPRAGGPFNLEVKGNNTIVFTNVMVGEVWLCSGQSNMQMPMQGWPDAPVEDGREEIAKAYYPMMRFFTVPLRASSEPVKDCNGTWQICSPEAVGEFSAVSYFFGRELYNNLKVPIGLIHSSWGGTPAESWTRLDFLENAPELHVIIEDIKSKTLNWQKTTDQLVSQGKQVPEKPYFLLEQSKPSYLYNGMINPIIPYGIKGAIWYQGESNADRAYQYRKLFPTMIENWRHDWGIGNFPFYFVQLASYVSHQPTVTVEIEKGDPSENQWAELREAQLLTFKRLENAGMAVAIDIGQANNIHPAKKKEIGHRLALWALARDYGRNVTYSGPCYKSMKVESERVRIFFDYAENGLVVKGEKLDGFAIAGTDKKFVWAKAEVCGNNVMVWNENIKKPVAVRYGWAGYPLCNLYNTGGLPASPFRTDD